MLEMYTWAWQVRSATSLLLALCVFSQTLLLALSLYRQPRGRRWLAQCGLELALLLQILCCSQLFGQVHHAYEATIIAPTGNFALRTAACLLVVIAAVAATLLSRKPWPLLNTLAAAVTLPIMEPLLGRGFSYGYVVALLFYLIRSMVLSRRRYLDIKTGISSNTVKNAIDSLRTGILFYDTGGFVLLANTCMQQLMAVLSGKNRRNGLHFYELVSSGELPGGCSRAELAGQTVCLLPDGSARMFTRTELRIKAKTYLQLTATDISTRWRLTAELKQQKEQLRQQGEELGAALQTLHVLSREKETQNAKARAHDILGQRLTLLLRTLREEQEPATELTKSLVQGLMEDLAAAQEAPSAQDAFENLRQTFAAIGVDLQCSGPLPEGEVGRLLIDILRESATNAVRHGFATQVQAQLEASGAGTSLRITNNGRSPSDEITEGGGLGGIRRKLEPYGGTLHIQTQPDFALIIHLPGGGADV